MAKSNQNWLVGELPKLVERGLLTGAAAEAIREYYRAGERKDYDQKLLMTFAVIGASLIALGILFLFAFNWSEMPRALKTALSFFPLAAAQGLCLFVLARKPHSPAWKESSSTFLFIAFGACVALISQTYHISGDFPNFLLTWMVLSLPAVYLMDASLASLLYLIGITWWSGYVQAEGGEASLFWVLLLAILPRLLGKYRRNRYSGESAYMTWILALCVTVATGITLEKVLPGLWIVIYAGLFSVFYLLGKLYFDDGPTLAQRPFHAIGTGGIVVMGFLLTYSWPWKEVGWHYLRDGRGALAAASMADYAVLALIAGGFAFLAARSFSRGRRGGLFFGAFFPLSAASFALVALSAGDAWNPSGDDYLALLAVHVFYNLFLLALGVAGIVEGARRKRLSLLNGGSLIIAALICLRFVFVEDFFEDLVARGIVFILLGIAFFAGNFFFSRLFKKGGEARS